MSFPFYIARRYTISRSKSTAVNIITGIASLGIFVSTAALFIILSVFSGLRDFSLSFANTTDPDLKIGPKTGKSFLVTPNQEKQLKAIKDIAVYSPVAQERVMFSYEDKGHVAYLKGVDTLYNRVTPMDSTLLGGTRWFKMYTGQVVAGYGVFHKLSLGLFDLNRALEVFVPKAGKGTIDSAEEGFNTQELIVVGIYSINEDVDNQYVYCSIDLAQDLLQYKRNQYTAIEMRLVPGANENKVRKQLEAIFNNSLTIKNRAQLNDSLYKMLNAENLVTYLFCSLVVVLTLFCLAGALIMLILDKKENIKTLYNLGAEVKSLRRIFFYQGIFITALGTFFGLILAVIIVILQQQFSLLMITESMAYPAALLFENVIIVVVTIFTLGILASRIAAGRVGEALLEN
ncbi:ABC transporter permease [Flavobacterium subsaxonicum]|uniref:Membrane protein n=1 Tax=Flavobacterium subsaxonicum WB 4.1-42 = DSM 21790 TaxID=1121898 RepID=A0A0A2MH61_9FLAO|nr:ABC transporter permease [Flavobacterium subsaxonicum]KGO91609.1 membrane protein [Flavobacterium subsaxonicum WB 4.1-42 = DSM 21790]